VGRLGDDELLLRPEFVAMLEDGHCRDPADFGLKVVNCADAMPPPMPAR
jgi:hypothetical protein